MHMTIAVPGATTASTGLPDNNKAGRSVDHERGYDDRPPHDAWRIASIHP